MSSAASPAIGRRQSLAVLGGAAAWVASATRSSPTAADAASPAVRYRLDAGPARASLAGDGYPQTDVRAYGGTVPGPTLRVRQGERVQVVVGNGLGEGTTVHWHGIRLPNAMDGVPGLTQPPIRPGESFNYEFTAPDAGTFWYHPHLNSLEQLGRGLAGALVVDEPEPPAVDRDLLWVLGDWRLAEDAQIVTGFGNRMEAAMAGRVGNTVTINGRVLDAAAARAGERWRLRLLNAATGRIMALRLEGHQPLVVALDGQPCTPHEPAEGRVLLGPGMRADLVLDMVGEPGRRYAVVDDFYEGLAYRLVDLAYADDPPLREHPLAGVPALPPNPLAEPDIASAARHELALQGGMMSMAPTGGGAWAVNGVSMGGDGHAGMAPSLTLQRGRTCLLTLRNETAWWHPMHLHGHAFRILRRDGRATAHREWRDTVLMRPRETVELAFVADNRGDWMLHCHVADHQIAGLMTVLRVA